MILHRNGYFVIGRPNGNFTADLLVPGRQQLIPNDAGGIALYHGDIRNYTQGQAPTNDNLQDAVVYGSQDVINKVFIDTLLPGQKQITEDQGFLSGDESIIRCQCCNPLQTSAFKLGRPTPGRRNPCITPTAPSSTEVFINEIGVRTRLFSNDYIELRGMPNLAMDNYFIVLYGINGTSYFSLQLEKTIGSDGFYLIGSANMSPPPIVRFPPSRGGTIHEDGGALALYHGYAGDVPKGSDVTDKNLIDAIVYTASPYIPVDAKSDILTLTQGQFFADLTRFESVILISDVWLGMSVLNFVNWALFYPTCKMFVESCVKFRTVFMHII